MGKANEAEHTLLYTYFLKRKAFALLMVGATIFCLTNVHSAMAIGSSLDLFNSLIVLVAFLPISIFVRTEGKRLFERRVNEIFSNKNEKLKSLFTNDQCFEKFVRTVRTIIFSRTEYFLIVGVLIFLLVTDGSFVDIFIKGRAFEILQGIQPIVLAENVYAYVFWRIIAASFFCSMIWAVLGIVAGTILLGMERNNFGISKSILELKKMLSGFNEDKVRNLDFSSIDLSFGKLKDGLSPFIRMTRELSLAIATFGFVYSVPAIVYFFVTHNISNSIYYGFCFFAALMSCLVLIVGEVGIRGIWNMAKDEAMVMLEQLCDRVKMDCMKSIVSLQDFHSRENLQKDVTFVRTTIEDLKGLKTSEFTISTLARVLTTIILPYIPLIAKLLGLY